MTTKYQILQHHPEVDALNKALIKSRKLRKDIVSEALSNRWIEVV